MNTRIATFWVVPGFIVSVVDAWLSIQSMAGMMHAVNVLGYVFAAIAGVALTAFAVLYPILKAETRNVTVALVALWAILTIADIGTSTIGAIWYVQLGNPLTRPVNPAQLTFDPGNTITTLGYVASVLIVAWCCLKFGEALQALRGESPSPPRRR